jgi:hypothetical protein
MLLPEPKPVTTSLHARLTIDATARFVLAIPFCVKTTTFAPTTRVTQLLGASSFQMTCLAMTTTFALTMTGVAKDDAVESQCSRTLSTRSSTSGLVQLEIKAMGLTLMVTRQLARPRVIVLQDWVLIMPLRKSPFSLTMPLLMPPLLVITSC